MEDVFDCLVIGAGPAGLTASLYLRRFRRTVAIADAGFGRAALIIRSHNFPGFTQGVKGAELLGNLTEQIARHGPVEGIGRVLRLNRTPTALWRAELQDGSSRLVKTILLATGVVDRRPPFPDPEAAIEEGLLRFCPICDGFEAMLERIAVIGNDDHAAREALFLRGYSPSISLLTLGAHHAVSPNLREDLRRDGVALVAVVPDSLIVRKLQLHARSVDGTNLPPFDVVYGALGVEPQTQLAKSIGVLLDPTGAIMVDDHQQTSVPSVYAAGDVVRGLNQISVAVGEAAIAATAIHNSLPNIRIAARLSRE